MNNERVDTLIRKLKTISKLEPSEKIMIDDNGITIIDFTSYNYERMKKKFYLEDRVSTRNKLEKLYHDIEEFSQTLMVNPPPYWAEDDILITLKRLNTDIIQSCKGIKNLILTYNDDKTMRAHLETISERINILATKMDTYLVNHKPGTNVTPYYHPRGNTNGIGNGGNSGNNNNAGSHPYPHNQFGSPPGSSNNNANNNLAQALQQMTLGSPSVVQPGSNIAITPTVLTPIMPSGSYYNQPINNPSSMRTSYSINNVAVLPTPSVPINTTQLQAQPESSIMSSSPVHAQQFFPTANTAGSTVAKISEESESDDPMGGLFDD